ncbi:MAG: hypothetical protein QOG48_997 [Verrucomicrobiota bacterium]|jgi:hypothetical protein
MCVTLTNYFRHRSVQRQAGKSLRATRETLFDDFTPYLMLAFAFLIVCWVEFTQYLAGRRLHPLFWLLPTVGLIVVTGTKAFRLRARLQRLRRGEFGERSVAEILDRIRAQGFSCVHDLPGNTGNIDHVVVGPSGIYAIETKMRSGTGTITYRASGDLIFGGRINDKRALWQARSAAAAIGSQLREQTKTPVWVKPLVVFVGEWRVRRDAGDYAVDVIAAKELEQYFDRQQPELTRSEIASIASHLERTARG